MTTIEDFADGPFGTVCLALKLIGVEIEAGMSGSPPPNEGEDFRLTLSLSPGLEVEVDHDGAEEVLSIAILVDGIADRPSMLRHALAANDILPPHRTISLRPTGRIAVRARFPLGPTARLNPEDIAAETADLARIAELLEQSADDFAAASGVPSSSEGFIRG
jgi:hypothetical protein